MGFRDASLVLSGLGILKVLNSRIALQEVIGKYSPTASTNTALGPHSLVSANVFGFRVEDLGLRVRTDFCVWRIRLFKRLELRVEVLGFRVK